MSLSTTFSDTLTQCLATSGITVECVEVTGSTNDDLKTRIRTVGLRGPILRTSRRQTAGRGTRGKTWKTPTEALLFSIALPLVTHGDERARLPIVVGISVAETLNRFGYPVQLKWPNDLWIVGGKTGGILCEHVNGCAVIGIGINLAAAPDHTTQGWPVRSLRDAGPAMRADSSRAAELLAALTTELLAALQAFPMTPVAFLPGLWRAVDAFWRRKLLVRDTEAGALLQGTARGINEEGALLLDTVDGLKIIRNGSLCPLET